MTVEQDFPEFASGILKGLYRAALTDTDTFLLALSGGLLGATRRGPRGLGYALLAYVTFRRLDTYVSATIGQLVQMTQAQQPAHHNAPNTDVR